MADSEREPLIPKLRAPTNLSLYGETDSLLGDHGDHVLDPVVRAKDEWSPLTAIAQPPCEAAAPACCLLQGDSDYQPLPNWADPDTTVRAAIAEATGHSDHELADSRAPSCLDLFTEITELATANVLFVAEHIRKARLDLERERAEFLEGLLTVEDRQKTRYRLFAEDGLRISWFRLLAKIASRQLQVCCIPVSELARAHLIAELNKIKHSAVETTTVMWATDPATQISGTERVSRIVSEVMRRETESHAFEETTRKKTKKNVKQSDHSLFRQTANKFEPTVASPKAIADTHSDHPIAGASRNVGVSGLHDALQSAGFRGFDTSKSGSKRDAKAAGIRLVNHIKDLQHPNPDDRYEPGMVYVMVNHDMYLDNFTPFAGSNIVIVTPEYNNLAGVGTNSIWYYTVNKRGQVVVVERVSAVGGETYANQRPWNYTANEFIYLDHEGGAAFTTYNVITKYQPNTHFKFVWLARNETTYLSKEVCDMMHAVVDGEPVAGVPLKKADNVTIVHGSRLVKQETFLCGMFGESTDPTYCIKRAYDIGPKTSILLTENQFFVFNLMGRNRPKGYGVSEVKRTLQAHFMWRPGGIEPLIVDFFGIPAEFRPQPNILYTRREFPVSEDGSNGDPVQEDVAEVGNATQGAPNAFGGGPGVADTKSDAAFSAYKDQRFDKYKNDKVPAEGLQKVLEMLLGHMINQISLETGISKGSMTLPDASVIYEKRTGALQAARLKRFNELLAKEGLAKVNLKTEVTPKAGASPRAVTQYTEGMAILTGQLGLLIKEILKYCSFYMPGKPPSDTAAAIRHMCEAALEAASGEGGPTSGIHDTDYTKMDETISQYIYGLFMKFVLAFVHPDAQEEVKSILEKNVNISAMLNGDIMKTGFKNNSGSGVTTELNTFVGAFIEYVSTTFAIVKYVHRLRFSKELNYKELDFSNISCNMVRGALREYLKQHSTEITHVLCASFMFDGHDPNMYSLAYAMIGPKFGDDGEGAHLPHITDDDWQSAATFVTESIGMVLKISFSRPEKGAFFLGRYYPNPLESDASYADVPKACKKISVARNMDPETYKMKLRGYWTTDSKTPGISHYLTAVARIYQMDLTRYQGIIEYDDAGNPVLSNEMSLLFARDRDMFYRVINGPYNVDDSDIPMMLEAVATQIGYDNTSEASAWLDALSRCSTWEELDEFQIPGGDYDPDDDPEWTTRMSGPVARLTDGGSPGPSMDLSDISFDELVAAADIALEELLNGGWVVGDHASDSA